MAVGAGPVALSAAEIAVGILLLINPVGFTRGIIIGVGALVALAGAWAMLEYFRTPPAQAAMQKKLAKGLSLLLMGLFCMANSAWFLAAFPLLTVLYGVAILFLGVLRVQWTVDELRMKTGRWPLPAIGAGVALLLAAVILTDPFATTGVLWSFVGISLIVEAALDIAAYVAGRRAKRISASQK